MSQETLRTEPVIFYSAADIVHTDGPPYCDSLVCSAHRMCTKGDGFTLFEVLNFNGYFILAINQLDAKNLFFSKFISCLYMFRERAHHHEVKIVLYSLWYHHICRWPSRARDGHL